MADIAFSELTAAVVGDLGATTTIMPVSTNVTTTALSRKITFGTLASWLATVGFAALTLTVGGITSATGQVNLGTTPGTTAAINIDTATSGYNATALRAVNGTGDLRVVQNASGTGDVGTFANFTLRLFANSASRWEVIPAASTSQLVSSQVTARIVGGSTNGFAFRNSGNTRDNFSVSDNGNTIAISNGTQVANIFSSGGSGETRAGYYFSGAATSSWAGVRAQGAGTSSGIIGLYFDGTVDRSAWEAANTTGFSNLLLMKSGGDVTVGPSTATATNATAGFLYIPTMAGSPSGTPTNTAAGRTAIVYDSTNHRIYVYEQASGAWRYATTTT